MARLYTKQDIAKALKELRIRPVDDMVTGNEAALILSWRAKDEFGLEYAYDSSSIRQHVRSGNFPPGSIHPHSKRLNLYRVEAVFNLPITPKRGISRKQDNSQTA